ncbi:uncharacterized protein LOC111350069 isoform X2 [Spodoptera litura]|uniref:Uncharacterized protein LOC111350069 isoform X2 n=1 Tax=Spodoptera litura TaxID=69820 RepID=A0A9J7IKE9_SPOLT|nr:uncharacterized protein LOC111350069 isoform X2 [Spodoptera litura]
MFRTKFTFFLLLLQWVPSLLTPLPQEDKSTLDDLATLDPNTAENYETVSTKVKKSTISLKDATEPAIDNSDNLGAKTTVATGDKVKEEINTKSDKKGTNDHDASKHDTPVIIDEDLELPKAETPSFRSLVPLIKLKNHIPIPIIFKKQDLDLAQDILKGGLIPHSNNLPIDGLVGNAFDFIRRLKRDTEQIEKDKENCNSVNADENCEPKSLGNLKSNLNSEDKLNLNKDAASSTVLTCPMSVFLKIVSEEILNQLDDSQVPKNVRAILNSMAKGNDDTLRLINKELSGIPIPMKVKVELHDEDTKNVINELSDFVDTALCSTS